MTSSTHPTQKIAKDNPKIKHTATQIDPRFKALDLQLKRYHQSQDALIEILHKAQESFGYLEDKDRHLKYRQVSP